MEGHHGVYGEPCRDGGSHARLDGNLTRSPAGHRSAHTPGGFGSVRVPCKSLDLGVGYGVDLGAAGSSDGIPCAFNRRRGPNLGCRRLAGAAMAVLALVRDLSRGQVRVSIIIPTHNEASAIARVLA